MFTTSKNRHTRSITTRRESLRHDQRFISWANEPVHSLFFFRFFCDEIKAPGQLLLPSQGPVASSVIMATTSTTPAQLDLIKSVALTFAYRSSIANRTTALCRKTRFLSSFDALSVADWPSTPSDSPVANRQSVRPVSSPSDLHRCPINNNRPVDSPFVLPRLRTHSCCG